MTVESPDVVGIIYGILFSPVDTMKRFAEKPQIGIALAVFLVASTVSALASSPALAQIGISYAGLGVVATVAIGILFLLLGTAAIHLAAEILGGHGRATTLLSLLALASLPEVFAAPLLMFGRVLPLANGVGSLVVSIWVLVLNIIGIKTAYSLSTGRAIAAWILPGIAMMIVLILFIIIIGMTLVNSPLFDEILKEFQGL